MRLLFAIIFITGLPYLASGQFVEIWGTSGNEAVHGILATSDGGHIIYGLTDGTGEGQDDFMLIKNDAEGELLWAYTYGTTGIENGHAVGVDEMPNGDLYLTGSWEQEANDPDRGIITKLDGDGAIVWTKMLVGTSLYYRDGFHQVKQIPDGNLLAAGWSQSTSTGNQDPYLMKFTPDGEFIADKAFGGGYPDHSLEMELDGDGFFLAHSGASLGPGEGAAGLARFDFDLQLIWNKMYGSLGDESLGDMVLRPDGMFMLFGRSQLGGSESGFVSLVDAEGSLQWTRTIGAVSGSERINDALFLADESYIISLTSLSSERVIMARFDALHQLLWAKSSPFGTSSEVEFRAENQVLDGNEILCVTDIEGVGFGGRDIEIDRYDPDFGPCDWDDIELEITLVDFTEEEIDAAEEVGGSLMEFELFRNDLTIDTLSLSDCFIDYCQFEGEISIPSLCSGDEGTFVYDLSETPPGTLTWEWQIGDSGFGSEQALYTAVADGTLTIELLITSDEIPDCTYEVDTFFQVTPVPQFEILGPDSLCEGVLGVFEVDNVLGEVLWSTDEMGATIESSFDVNTVLEVTMGIGECLSSETFDVVVVPFPTGSIVGPELICIDDQVTFTVEGAFEELTWGNGMSSESLTVLASADSLVTVSLSNAMCSLEDSYSYVVHYPAEISSAMELELCEGLVHQLSAGGGEEYLWSNGSTGNLANYLILSDSIVWVEGFNSCGGETVEITIEAMESQFDGADTLSFTAETGSSQLIDLPDPYFFNVYSGSELICETCSELLVDFQEEALYTLTFENEYGCVLTSFLKINTLPCTDVFVPNSFSPNNDGVNDFFAPVCRATCIDYYDMKVFDRWGSVVFESQDVTERWSGAAAVSSSHYAADAVYSYRLLYSLADSYDVVEKLGSVTIVR